MHHIVAKPYPRIRENSCDEVVNRQEKMIAVLKLVTLPGCPEQSHAFIQCVESPRHAKVAHAEV